jgi:hypothetical protein
VALDPVEIVADFRLLGTVYRKAVMELDAAALRTFFLARAEQLIHLPDADLLEVLANEVTEQVRECQQLLADLRVLGRAGRKAPRVRLYRSNVVRARATLIPPNVVELDS